MISLPPISRVDPVSVGQSLVESDTFAVCALDGRVLRFASPALRVLLGLPLDASVDGLAFESLVVPSERAEIAALLAAPDTRTLNVTFTCLRPDKSQSALRLQGARTQLGHRTLFVAVLSDASGERRERENLSALAFVDPLTGLPNRAFLYDHLRNAIVDGNRDGRTFAVCFGDLDGFKKVNDTLGHDAGDAVLRQCAGRLRSATRVADTVARLGGDELALVLPSAGSRESAAIVAGRVVRAIAEPMVIRGVKVDVGISVGVALFPFDGADVDTLIAAADQAMYAAKRAGGRRFTFAERGGAAAPGRYAFLSWSEDHELGVAFMDADHRRLAELTGAIGEHLKAGHARDRLAPAFDALIEATLAHFAHEERVMTELGYPGLTAHAEAHARLIDDLQSLARDVDRTSMMLSMRYLSDWLLRHIDTVDRGLARWLREHHAAT